jgi:hypothetical protein
MQMRKEFPPSGAAPIDQDRWAAAQGIKVERSKVQGGIYHWCRLTRGPCGGDATESFMTEAFNRALDGLYLSEERKARDDWERAHSSQG